jgi:hypothetical protein
MPIEAYQTVDLVYFPGLGVPVMPC